MKFLQLGEVVFSLPGPEDKARPWDVDGVVQHARSVWGCPLPQSLRSGSPPLQYVGFTTNLPRFRGKGKVPLPWGQSQEKELVKSHVLFAV